MKTCAVLLVLTIAAWGQANPTQFEREHASGVEQNPAGVRLTIATADGRSQYRLSDELRFKLFFTSSKLREYTVEMSGGNSAAVSDDFVIQAPEIKVLLHSKNGVPRGAVCCASDRHYVGQAPKPVSSALFSLKWFNLPSEAALPDMTLRKAKFQPGEYAIFLQTRRVLRGWPKNERDRYHGISNFVVTSSNVLHITMSPDVQGSADPR